MCLSQPAKGCLLVHVGAGRKAQGEDTLGLGEKGENRTELPCFGVEWC